MSNNLKVSTVSYATIAAAAASVSPETTAHANATSTAEEAPYLPQIVSGGEWTLDDHCKAVAEEIGCTFEEARYWWNALMEEVAEVLTDGTHTSVEFGYWRFALAVSGSVPSANAEPTAENAVYVAVYPSAQLQAAAASIETKVDKAAAPFQIGCVFDVATNAKFVVAGDEFLVMGQRFTMGDEGEKVELIGPSGTVYPCTVQAHASALPTRIFLKCASTVPAGKKYALRVTAKGMGGITPTSLDKNNVEVVAGATPSEPYAESSDHLVKTTSAMNETGGVEGQLTGKVGTPMTWLFGGSGFARLSLGGYAKVHLTDALACDMVATVVDDATIRYVFDTTGQSIAAGSYPNAYVSFPYDGELLNVHAPVTVQPAA